MNTDAQTGAGSSETPLTRADVELLRDKAESSVGLDLSARNLRYIHLTYFDLQGANLQRADLQGANLRGANLSRADLRGANLSGADLDGADLSHARLGEGEANRVDLHGAKLSHATLRELDLRGFDLTELDLRNADLNGADLRDALLQGTDLRGADLSTARLHGPELRGAKLHNDEFLGNRSRRANPRIARQQGLAQSEARLMQKSSFPPSTPEVAERISRIEHGLIPAHASWSQAARRDTIMERMAEYKVPGLSVAVISSGEVEWARGYGVLGAGRTEQVTPETIFQVCSISKHVAAMGVLRLVQEGLLDLDEDVNHYLVSWKIPANGSWQPAITLRQLLGHTAGLVYNWYRGFRRGELLPTLLQVLEGLPPASDLARLACEIQRAYTGRPTTFLGKAIIDQALTPQVSAAYGLGIQLEGKGVARRFGHSGDNIGYKCLSTAYLEHGMGAVVLTNSDDGSELITEVLQAIANEYAWPDYSPRRTPAATDASRYDAYIGEYELRPHFSLTISRQEDTLLLRATGQPPLQLHPSSEDTFFAQAVSSELTFTRDEAGKITGVILRQEEQETEGKRVRLETDTSPVYSKPFFELQLVFAQKIADVSQQPLDQVLLHFTAFYRILGLDWSLDPTNPVWQAYTQGLQQASDKVDFTHQFYLQRYHAIPKFTDEEHWGCFAYGYNPETRAIHLHFSDADTSMYGPLSHQRIDVRKAELRMMFQQIQQRHPDATLVLGGSWLYNWGSYTRLFPQAFGQSAKRDERPHLPGRAIWGQFLRRSWSIHQETMSLFLQRISQLERVEDYPQCFPYPVLQMEAPIHLFYAFYALA